MLQVGNPCLSSLVSSLKKTYSKQAWQLGYATTSAKAMTAGKYQQLMGALYAEIRQQLASLGQQSSTPVPYRFRAASPLLLLLRDAVAFSLEWQSSVRAHNAGHVQAADIQDRHGGSLLPQLVQPTFPFKAGFQWQFAPNGTKPCQQRRAGSPVQKKKLALLLTHPS